MKTLSIFCLLVLGVSCSHYRGPASTKDKDVASTSMAGGNIQAKAKKSVQKQDLCFDINLIAKGVERRIADPSNWTVAWIDHQEKFHLMNLNQRDPASVPHGGRVVASYGSFNEWSNHFKACSSKAKISDVKSLILTPKELPYKETEGMTLVWE